MTKAVTYKPVTATSLGKAQMKYVTMKLRVVPSQLQSESGSAGEKLRVNSELHNTVRFEGFVAANVDKYIHFPL